MQVNNIIDAYVIDRVFTPGARVRKGTNAYSDIHPHELVASCFRSIFSMGALMVAVKLNSASITLFNMYVSPHMFILQNYGNSSFTSFRTRITAKEIVK